MMQAKVHNSFLLLGKRHMLLAPASQESGARSTARGSDGVVFKPLAHTHTHGSVSKLTPRTALATSISLGSTVTTPPSARRSFIDKSPRAGASPLKSHYKSSTLFYEQIVRQARQRQHLERRASIDSAVSYYTQDIIGNTLQSRLERKFTHLARKFSQSQVTAHNQKPASSLDDSLSTVSNQLPGPGQLQVAIMR